MISKTTKAQMTIQALIRTWGLDELEETPPLARQLAPIFALHDKRTLMYYPSMHRLSLRREMQRW